MEKDINIKKKRLACVYIVIYITFLTIEIMTVEI